jgi:copper homeostasis protein
MKIEFCIESEAAAKAAQKHSAHRIELCRSLDKDGLTPTIDLIKSCKAVYKGEIHMMIRPKEGDFHYNENELIQMKKEIKLAHQFNLKGVVFGLLLKNGNLDIAKTKVLHKYAKKFNLETTFHRAFDHCKKPLDAINQLIDIGVDRLLTSGQKEKAINGINLIEELIDLSKKRIQIMAGSGIDEKNVMQFSAINVDAVHFSIHNKNTMDSNLNYINEKKIIAIIKQINSQ